MNQNQDELKKALEKPEELATWCQQTQDKAKQDKLSIKIDLNKIMIDGETLLNYAFNNGYFETIQKELFKDQTGNIQIILNAFGQPLKKYPVDVMGQNEKDGDTVLHLAVKKNDLKNVESFIEALQYTIKAKNLSKNINVRNKVGHTTLDCVNKDNDKDGEIAKLLIGNGAKTRAELIKEINDEALRQSSKWFSKLQKECEKTMKPATDILDALKTADAAKVDLEQEKSKLKDALDNIATNETVKKDTMLKALIAYKLDILKTTSNQEFEVLIESHIKLLEDSLI